ncbi:hypothetical protein FOXG_20273 [Fusarium oxysporum f. sp. lycopersici 4287]|uniref:Uncharacterized protein n=2 Tax=Fusarium oxysporum TaxID=5507 RepID=A0A0J9VFW2_FUSO4|nr:hypothetical protein FOXG_20273 [Fusarium oxysporum f. sp. lycopersici 4287]EXK40017.1 hypothetical protein FOMG_07056 [Fusarium oxysporum f. sp. melonis 26406]KNB09845.1 hypothetical protein FOXG_20273 [Fusarium oxysporum f. sp. lycopersici 4287]
MGHLSQIEAVMEAYDDILYHYPDDGEDPLNMPKKEVIFEREAIKGLDDFIETAHKLERLYQEDPSPNVIWLADDYVASLSQRLSQLAHTFGVLVPSLQDTGTASGQ